MRSINGVAAFMSRMAYMTPSGKPPQRRYTRVPERRYPRVYERLVPIALGIIAVMVVILLLVAAAVALGLFLNGT